VDAYSQPARRKPVQFTIGTLLVLTTVCAFSTFVGRKAFRLVEGRGTSASIANKALSETLCILRVPDGASKVDFSACFQSGDASFNVTESEFLTWAESHSWKLSEVKLSGTVPASWELSHMNLDWPQDGRRVWYYTNASHRGGWTIMYDRDRGRGYVQFAAH